jgi:predicted nucleic acid-binding protein
MRPAPATSVLVWMATQPAAALHVASVSYAEILYGIDVMPEGRRRRGLAEQAEAMFAEDFAGRMLGFDAAAARAYATIAGGRRRAGRPSSPSTA